MGKWLPQRTRWLKGWMVTLMVMTRQPRRLLHDLGIWSTVAVTGTLFGAIAGCLFGPLFGAIAVAEMIWGSWLAPHTTGEALCAAASCCLLFWGMVSALWPIGLGLKRRRRLDLLP